MNELALFAGAGGGILGGKLLGWRTVCAVELNPYCRRVLMQRQNDGLLPPFPIWDDVLTFDGKPWRGIVDVVSGGFPCQDISIAGKGEGISGSKSGLWREFARIIREVRPSYVFVENSPMLALRGLGDVLRDLALSGYNARWGVLGAHDVGAPHKRDRIWIVAHANSIDLREPKIGWTKCKDSPVTSDNGSKKPLAYSNSMRELSKQTGNDWVSDSGQGLANPEREGLHERYLDKEGSITRRSGIEHKDWPVEPDVGRVAHGVAFRVDRLKAIGNGQVPQVARRAFMILCKELFGEK